MLVHCLLGSEAEELHQVQRVRIEIVWNGRVMHRYPQLETSRNELRHQFVLSQCAGLSIFRPRFYSALRIVEGKPGVNVKFSSCCLHVAPAVTLKETLHFALSLFLYDCNKKQSLFP